MRQLKLTALAAAALLSTAAATSAFAQTGMTGGMESSPVTGTPMPDATGPTTNMNDTPMNGNGSVDQVNRDARSPATNDTTGTYDSRMPADRSSMSGRSGTEGTTATGNTGTTGSAASAGYGNATTSQYGGAANDKLNGSGHYADMAHGSQLEANNYHSTPQPGALNNQLYRGN